MITDKQASLLRFLAHRHLKPEFAGKQCLDSFLGSFCYFCLHGERGFLKYYELSNAEFSKVIEMIKSGEGLKKRLEADAKPENLFAGTAKQREEHTKRLANINININQPSFLEI